jgi:cytochrome c oxidase subunit II
MPAPVTKQTQSTLHLWQGVMVVAIIIGALVWALILWSIFRYRKRPGDDTLPQQTQYHIPIEVAYTIIPVIIVAVIFGFVVRAQNRIDHTVKNPVVTVRVEGFQWGWRFTYLRNDGTAIGPSIVGNQDSYPTLTLPTKQTVRLILVSDDVDHSFYVPDFLFKRDLIPKVDNKFDVFINKTGRFEGHCAEFCGLLHARMNFFVQAVPLSQFHFPAGGAP